MYTPNSIFTYPNIRYIPTAANAENIHANRFILMTHVEKGCRLSRPIINAFIFFL